MLKKTFILISIISLPVISSAQTMAGNFILPNNTETSLPWGNSHTQEDFFSDILGYKVGPICNSRIYEFATDWLRTRYHFGGCSKQGVDCSSFTKKLYDYCYNIPLFASTANIFNQVQLVDRDQLQEGDLIFFKIRRKRISHIGVYLGNNKFIHASTQRGVTVSDIDDPYYKRYFYKAGRHPSFITNQ